VAGRLRVLSALDVPERENDFGGHVIQEAHVSQGRVRGGAIDETWLPLVGTTTTTGWRRSRQFYSMGAIRPFDGKPTCPSPSSDKLGFWRPLTR
jgi:hypothetical protein